MGKQRRTSKRRSNSAPQQGFMERACRRHIATGISLSLSELNEGTLLVLSGL
jgi:hypothetical protein